MIGETAGNHYPTEVTEVVVPRTSERLSFANEDIAYFVVTRFNLSLPGLSSSAHFQKALARETSDRQGLWERRTNLFLRYCLPSVVNMQPPPDRWFIGFDADTAADVSKVIEALRYWSWIVPVFADREDGWESRFLAPPIQRHAADLRKTLVCSARLDSDDSLHFRFLWSLDRVIRQRRDAGIADEEVCLNATYGLFADGQRRMTTGFRPSGQFAAIFEPAANAQGPYRGNHVTINERFPVVEMLSTCPLWIYSRHIDSYSGSQHARGRLNILAAQRLLAEFGLEPVGIQSGISGSTSASLDMLLAAQQAFSIDPDNSRLKKQRDRLASGIRSQIDADEQHWLATFATGYQPVAGRVLHIAAESFPFSGSLGACLVHDRAFADLEVGLSPAVVTLLPFPWNLKASDIALHEEIDGVDYHRLQPDRPMPKTSDALREMNLKAMANLVRQRRPEALVAGASPGISSIALSIARAFGLRVSFNREITSALPD